MTHPQLPDRQDPPLPFHTLPEEELFFVLGSSPTGLTSVQAEAGLARLGKNDISRISKPSVIFQYLGHFKNLLVI